MPSIWGNKKRRPHTKSRNGCARCKGQRRKCDEGSPSCTRCAELKIKCQYPGARMGIESPGLQSDSMTNQINADLVEKGDGMRSPSDSTTLNEEGSTGSAALEVYTSNPQFLSLSDMQLGHRDEALRDSSLPPLDAQDLQLLTHYLSHTSQTIPYDKIDLYAMQIGIPNLAFGSKPLMSSVLALAAVCQCHDFLSTTEMPCNLPWPQIQKLLELSEKHHRDSLHQIQEAIGTQRYDVVLANATLMTLYGSAVHCVRIRLVNLHKEGRLGASLLSDFVPAQSQWISLIRATHSAFLGLRADSKLEGMEDSASFLSFQDADEEFECDDGVGEVKCPQDGPAETTLRFFLPIVTATIGGAMEKLRLRVKRKLESSSADTCNLEACKRALEILEATVLESLRGIDELNATATTESSGDDLIGRLSLVAPWLRAYTARVTSNSHLGKTSGSFTSSPLRRKITAFLNRVDMEFLSLVQETMERMTFQESRGINLDPEDESAANQCAIDIFAHWLVLMCLLDGVWWIGGIGMWELERVVRYLQRLHDGEDGQNTEAWWPASMYAIRMELARQRI